jgi:uncharacterized protein YkwD
VQTQSIAFRTWPLVAAAAFMWVLVALSPSGRVGATGDCNPGEAWPAADGAFQQAVLDLVNAHRAGLDLHPLKLSPNLQKSAEWKARHMAHYKYMKHDDPDPPVARTWDDRIRTCGYDGGGIGENIAAGYASPEAVFHGWLNSEGHRDNIEGSNYVVIGIGVARSSSGGWYWAQTFGTEDDSGAGGGNGAPNARDDSAATPEDKPVTVNVRANDSDPDGDGLTIASVGSPQHGSASVVNGSIVYTPDANYNGGDSLSYTVDDGEGGTDSAQLNLTVNAVNDRPIAKSEARTIRGGRTKTVAVLTNDSDPDGDSLHVSTIVRLPVAGQATLNDDSTITFTAPQGYTGKVSVRYRVSDGNGRSALANLIFYVKP